MHGAVYAVHVNEITMKAVVTTGHGGYDALSYRDVPAPRPDRGEVVLEVLAAGINNTDINLRVGWYGTPAQDPGAPAPSGADAAADGEGEGGWNRPPPFPLIQGADACGRVAEVGEDVDPELAGRRVLVRACVREHGFQSLDTVWMGSDFDGAFAQYVRVRATEVFPVACAWTDAELGSIPCAYGTAENMLQRANVGEGDRVLVTGASGGVGSATVQLARRRGAHVIAVTRPHKRAHVQRLGAEAVLDYADLANGVERESIDVAVDNVAGSAFPLMTKLLRRGGRLVSSGAVAGPLVELDLRELYLKDASLLGTTAWDEAVFPDLVRYIERDEIRPVVAATFPLSDIVRAQQAFLERDHVGKLVLLPWEA